MNSWSQAYEICYDQSKVHKFCVNSGWKFGRSYVRHCKHHDSRNPKGLNYSPSSSQFLQVFFYYYNIRPVSHLRLCQSIAFPWSYRTKKLVCIFHVSHGYCMFRPSNSPQRKESKIVSEDKSRSFSPCNFYRSATAWFCRINAVLTTFLSNVPQVLIHSTGHGPIRPPWNDQWMGTDECNRSRLSSTELGLHLKGRRGTTVYGAQFFGRDTIQPPTHDKNNNINLGNTGSANGIINHVRQGVQAF